MKIKIKEIIVEIEGLGELKIQIDKEVDTQQAIQTTRISKELFKEISAKAQSIFQEKDVIPYIEFIKRIKESLNVNDNAINVWMNSSIKKGFIKMFEHQNEKFLVLLKPWWKNTKTTQTQKAIRKIFRKK